MNSNTICESEQEEVKFTEMPFNSDQSIRLESLPIYAKYKKWLKNNGAIMDSRIRYPSYFGSQQRGVVGISASKSIQKKKAIIAIPYNLMITINTVKSVDVLNQIIKQNPAVFRIDDDAALRMLILFISYELVKKEKSFYQPYLSISSLQNLQGWSNWTLYLLQHQGLISSIRQQKQACEREFMNFLRIYRRYEEVFPQNISNTEFKQIFEKAYIFVITRAFGWSLPSISLIPLADSLNHGNIRYVNHYLINIDHQKAETTSFNYFKYGKRVNLAILKDQSFNLTNQQLTLLRYEGTTKVAKFVEKHRQLLLQSQSLSGNSQKIINLKSKSHLRAKQFHILFQQYKAGIHKLQNLHFYESSCSEDNDTDQQELFNRQLEDQKFKLNDRGRVIKEESKKKEVKKIWKLYYDNIEDEQDDGEIQKVVANNQLKNQIQSMLSKQNDSSSVQSEESEEQDQTFEWIDVANHNKTYFIMNSKQIIRQNQQIYNFYGRRSNKFLLLGYNFVLKDNIYDSYPLKIKLDQGFTTKVNVSKLLQVREKKDHFIRSRQLKLKRYLINSDLINICRSYIILWTKKEWKNCRLTIPFDRQVEFKTLELYQQIIRFILNQFTTSIEEDEELQENTKLKHEERIAIMLREEYKKILKGQDLLVDKCQMFLKKWKINTIQNFQEADMKWIKRIKSYLVTLEQATSL